VAVVGQGKSKRAAYCSNSLTVQTSDNYGQVRVTDEKGRKALSGVYVKAHAKMKDGNTRFYKDGYTDLRGRFDYASLSTNDLDNVGKTPKEDTKGSQTPPCPSMPCHKRQRRCSLLPVRTGSAHESGDVGAQWLACVTLRTDAQDRPVARSAPPLKAEVAG